jgi:hydrogenase maturation protease
VRPRARIVALGQTAAGDDGVGFAVLEALRRDGVPEGVELVGVAEPTALIPLLDAVAHVLLVDAAVGAGEAGEVLSLPATALETRRPRLLSSHGVGVAEAVALARALSPEAATTEVWVVAVCIDRPGELRHGLSPAITRAVPCAVAAVRAWVDGVKG